MSRHIMSDETMTMSATMESHRPPLQSVKKYCLWCCNNQKEEVKLCPSTNCPLHIYRFGHKKDAVGTEPSVIKSIRLRCIDCSCYNIKDVRECWDTECSLYPYRMGRNPNRAGIGGNSDALLRYKEDQETPNSLEEMTSE